MFNRFNSYDRECFKDLVMDLDGVVRDGTPEGLKPDVLETLQALDRDSSINCFKDLAQALADLNWSTMTIQSALSVD